ncbi:MAG: CapA family protein [Chloroflexi bacterium]|nr:CapA family protein [Chloroflexota bacterium]
MSDQAGSGDAIAIHLVGNVAPRRVEYGEPVGSLFDMVHQKIKEADISFCHLERVFSTRGCLQYRDHPTWNARVDPGNVESLVFAGFNVVSHAGNNCFDFGPDALIDSVDVIRKNGMQVIGAGKDIAEARAPAVVERKGIKAGFLAYNSVLPAEYEAREGKPGCAPLRVSTYFEAQGYQPGTPPKIITIPREDDVLAMEEDIRKLRSQVDVVVVSIHWGRDRIPGIFAMYQPTIGRRAIESGADLIIGHHGRIMRGIEIYKGRPIFYCLGNFAQEIARSVKRPPGKARDEGVPSSEDRKSQEEPDPERYVDPKYRRYTMMVKCVVNKKGVRKVSFLPCYTNQRAEPEFLSRNDQRFHGFLQCIEPQCQELGTALIVEGEEVVVFNSAGN